MRKIIYFIILFILLNNINSYSQKWGEYQYFVLRVGMTHNLLSGTPGTFDNKFLKTPKGEIQLKPVSSIGYIPAWHIDLYFHYDFSSDKAGIIFGIEYNNGGVSTEYETISNNYTLVEKFRANKIAVPLLLKFGREIFDDQRYIFVGVQYNLNLMLSKTEKVSWINDPLKSKGNIEELRRDNLSFIIGFNYMIFNIQLEYMPQNFLNKDYEITFDNINYKPFENINQNLFFIKTSFTLPLSDWAGTKNYKVRRFIRKIKFWR